MTRTLYHNANILTQNGKSPLASAMVVNEGRIEAVGSTQELGTSYDQVLDLQGKWILPGFNDAHIHVWKVGQLDSFIIDLRGIASIAALQAKVRAITERLPIGTWVMGRGFNESVLAEKRMPTKEDLDAISTLHPIYLIRTCAHIAVTNSLALDKAGVHSSSEAPVGGVIGRIPSGELNGIFYETALGLISQHIPPPSRNDYKQMILRGAERLLQAGVTSATDPAVHPELLEAYYELYREGRLPIRMNLMPILLPDGGLEPCPLPERYESEWLTVNTVKFFSDGGLSGKTAALKRPYLRSTDHGVLRLERATFLRLAREAQQKGFRIGTHAIGDAAIDMVIDVYKELYSEFGDTRNRIEHCGLPSDDNINDVARHGFVAVPQTIFLNELGDNFIAALDDQYLARCYPVRSLLDKNIPVAFSTDAPVVKEINPWVGIQSSITRSTVSGTMISGSEAVTVEEATFAYTMGSAFAEKKEHLKGSIEAGKAADFIVVDRNPLTTPAGQMESIRTLATYINGRAIVFE